MASAILPGLGQALQRRWLAASLFGLATATVIVAVVWVLSHDAATLVRWTVDPTVLGGLFLGGLLWAFSCFVAAADAGRTARPPASGRLGSRAFGGALIAVVAFAALVPGVAVAWVAVRQDNLLDSVFADSDQVVVARPSTLSDLGITTSVAPDATLSAPTSAAGEQLAAASTSVPDVLLEPGTVPMTVPPATTVPAPPPQELGRWNIALLGGDAGPRRWGLRTDTMIVVSIDRGTGDLAGISVPRNLRQLPMPAGPLRDRFPSGFDDLANALYPYVATHPELGLDPSQAIKGALAELLGIPIDNYVLVDMAGFVRIIDALGGVTVELSSRVPLVPNIDGQTREAEAVGPGLVRMNGAMALAFARIRQIDSDYGRMKRQRCLLAAVGRNTSASRLALNYVSLADAVQDAFQSDIPRDRLGELVALFAKVDIGRARSLALVPPVIQTGRPDIARIRSLVARSLDAAAPVTDPVVSSPTC